MALRLGLRTFASRLISSQPRCFIGIVPRMAWTDRSFATAPTKKASKAKSTKSKSTKSKSTKSKSSKSDPTAKSEKKKKSPKMKTSKKEKKKSKKSTKSTKSTKSATAVKTKPKKETGEVKRRGGSKAVQEVGPSKPKRPESAYLLFLRHQRETDPEYKKFASSPVTQTKRAAEEWKVLSDADKKPWNDKAALKQKDYEDLKKVYDKQKRPKRPLSAFLLYSQEKRASHTGTVSEVAKKIGAEWKQLSEADKQAYSAKANAAMDAWKLQSQDWDSLWQKKAATASS